MIFRLVALLIILMPLSTANASSNECSAWSSTTCWARTLQDMIDGLKNVPDVVKQYADNALAGVYQASSGLGDVAGTAGGVLQQAYDKLAKEHDKVCADDDLFFMESVGVIALGILAVEVSMTGGLSGGAGALALKGLLVSQSPKLMSKLHDLLHSPVGEGIARIVEEFHAILPRSRTVL